MEVKVKFKSYQSPWITKGIAKSSKKKQKLYEKFLKNRTPKNEETYETYKNLFETIKRRSKKKFYSEKFKGDAKKTWSVMKEILGKCTTKSSTLPTKITVNKTDIFDIKKIADEFNKFFTNIGTDLANKIPNASKRFDFYITKVNTSMESQPLSINELKDAFFYLK